MAGPRYRLAWGTQVRQEDFGLLFYTMKGPRLYFLSSGALLNADFFGSGLMLEDRFGRSGMRKKARDKIQQLEKQLKLLTEKGVVIEC